MCILLDRSNLNKDCQNNSLLNYHVTVHCLLVLSEFV